MNKISIMYKEPFKDFEAIEVDNKLEVFQKLVGGYIEEVRLEHGIILVCNEEGRMMGLHSNIIAKNNVVVGNIFLVGFDGKEDYTSLTDIQKAWVVKHL